MNVNRYTKAAFEGRLISCPWCGEGARVYHLAWATLVCIRCKQEVEKGDWELAETKE